MHHRFPSPAVPTPLRRAPKRAVPAHPNPRVWLTRGTERVQRRLRTARLAASSPGLYAAPWGSRAQQRLLRILLQQQIGDGARQRRGQLARRQRHSSQRTPPRLGSSERCAAAAAPMQVMRLLAVWRATTTHFTLRPSRGAMRRLEQRCHRAAPAAASHR